MVKEIVREGFFFGQFIHFGMSSWYLVGLCISHSSSYSIFILNV